VFFDTGEGRDNTTLLFNTSLTALGGNTWAGGNSQYTYGPALINFWGSNGINGAAMLSTVTRNASRGDTRLWVGSTSLFTLNTWVRLTLDNTANNSLAADLHSGLFPPENQHLNKNQMMFQHLRVVEVRRGAEETSGNRLGPARSGGSGRCRCCACVCVCLGE
jgi:hypothetical protein